MYVHVATEAALEVTLHTTGDGDLDREGNSVLYVQELANLFYVCICYKVVPGHHVIGVESSVPILQVPSINQDTDQGLGLGRGPVLVRQYQEGDGLILDLQFHHVIDTTVLGLILVLPYPGEGDAHLTGGM